MDSVDKKGCVGTLTYKAFIVQMNMWHLYSQGKVGQPLIAIPKVTLSQPEN